MILRVKKLDPEAKLPSYAHEDDAGLDLYALEGVTITPGETIQVRTGLALEIPDGQVGLIWDKSGLAAKRGLKTMGGVIDAGYRGEVLVGLINLSKTSYVIGKHNKIAQLLIQSVVRVQVEETVKLSDTIRGAGGFGSTGK